MSVQPGPTFKRYAANGVATVYAIPFLLLDAADLQITLDGTPVTTGFILAGIGNPTSSCTFTAAPTGDLLFLQVMTFQRLADYQINGDFLAQTVNRDYDRLWLAVKQVSRDSGRALTVSLLEPEGIPALPAKASRALKMLAFDAGGNPVTSNLTLAQIEQQPALALESAAAAALSATNAGLSEASAASSRDLAQKWATNPEDTPVVVGFFSALHWAAKALASASAAAATLANAVLKTGAQTMAGPLTVTGGITSIPFNKEFVSGELTIVNGGQLIAAHGFGVRPKFGLVELVCKVSDAGYAIGDVVPLNLGLFESDTNIARGAQIGYDTTNVFARVATIVIGNKAVGGFTGITTTSWKAVMRVYA